MNCKIGDLAIVVNAEYCFNIGNIVRIIAPHDGTGDIVFTTQGQVWFVECARPMKWDVHGKVYRRKRGPVPDSRLQPIHGGAADTSQKNARSQPTPKEFVAGILQESNHG